MLYEFVQILNFNTSLHIGFEILIESADLSLVSFEFFFEALLLHLFCFVLEIVEFECFLLVDANYLLRA
jgi:hypothetical protein